MIEEFLGDLDRFLDRARARDPAPATKGPVWQPLVVNARTVALDRTGPKNSFDITFPQAIIWGLIGCMMTFAIQLVVERTRGTMLRLQAAPVSATHILAGKALACFVAILLLEILLLTLGRIAFGVHPHSYPLLAAAGLAAAVVFVGLMMLASSFGKTEQAASAIGWATIMPLSMVGGGMIPLAFMPHWMSALSNISPMKWAILAFEGAIGAWTFRTE